MPLQVLSDLYSPYVGSPNGGAKYRYHLQLTLNSQDAVANTSSVHWKVTIEKDRSFSGFYAYTASWNCIINGVTVLTGSGTGSGSKPDAAWTGWTAWTLGEGDITIAHASNGTKTGIGVSGAYNGLNNGWAPGTLALAGGTGFDLPAISRATVPTVTPNPVATGAVASFALPRTNSSFTHDLSYVAGTLSGSIASAVATSYDWTVPNVSSGFSGASPWPIVVTVVTKNGATVIGTKTVTLYSQPAAAAPAVPTTLIDPSKQYDVRARLVKSDGSGWSARQVLPANEISMVDPASATATCDISLSLLNISDFTDYSIVDIGVYNGSSWVSTNHRFVLMRTEGDDVDASQVHKYSGIEFVDFELARAYLQKDYAWDGAVGHNSPSTPGDMLNNMILDAIARGWGPRIALSFNGAVDSNGTPWVNQQQIRTFSAGIPISQVLAGLVSDGLVEYRVHYDSTSGGRAWLDVYNPGTGLSFADNGAQPVVNLALAQLSRAPRRSTIEGRVTAVTVAGDSGNLITRTRPPFDTDVFGRLEGWVSATGIGQAAPMVAVGEHALDDNSSASAERTFEYQAQNARDPFKPYVTFKPNDWVLRPDPGSAASVKDRISQITLAKTADNSFSITVLTGDRILNGTASLAKRQAAAVGGSIAGGNQTSPSPLDSRIPAAVSIDTLTSAGYWNTDGAAKSAVTITWVPVTTGQDGSPLTVTRYEVYGRPSGIAAPWQLLTATDQLSATINGYDPLAPIDLRVRAQSSQGVFGLYSADQEAYVPLAPAVSLSGPGLTNLYTDGVGSLYAVWDGLLGGAAAPMRVAYVAAELSTDGGTTYATVGTQLRTSGTIVINPNAYGDFFVRLRAYDRLGNAGTASSASEIVTTDPHINPPMPAAPTSLTATPGAAWDASGYLPEAWFDLAWTSPTLDTDGHAVTIIGFDVYGLKVGESIERFITSVPANAARVKVGNGETWTFRVSASSDAGGTSTLSAATTATANASVPSTAAPAAPTLSQYAGILQIKWAGGGMVRQIKYVYASISQTVGGTYTRAGMPLVGAGEIDVPGLASGDYYAKITMVDELGNSVTSAAAGPITLLPITGVTIQTSSIPNTGIKMDTGSLTAYDASGNPTFILNANTGEVWIAPYDAVFDLGASGTVATTGSPVTGIAISSQNSSFNTFIHPSGVQIRNDQTPLSWWEADATDSGLVNFFSPRAAIGNRLLVGDYEQLKEAKATGTRLVTRYKGL